ncbi:phytase [Nocardioides sp. Soil777]|uniref:phytase n=1 Tax=Nocardioides sp. Soil777 TaxID=1736409 RepID=UPI000B28F3D1|nr:phytase [Nocardioides sp. Soil777]
MPVPGRRRRLWAASGLVASLSLVPILAAVESPVSAATTELVTNTSVETALAPWSSAYNASSRVERTTGGYDGAYAVRASNSQTVARDVGFRDKPSNVTSTVAGQVYDLSVWVRSEVAGRTINLKVKEITPSGSSPGVLTQPLQAPDTGWHRLALSYAARGAGNSLSFIVYATSVAPGQGFWADQFSVSVTTPDPTPTETPTGTETPTPTETPTGTETPTPTETPTFTETPTETPPPPPPPSETVRVASTTETVPTGVVGDTADDPAIWVDTGDPAASLVVTNEKTVRRLTVLDLSGQVVQRIETAGFVGNVDVRADIVAAAQSGIRLWRVATTEEGPRLEPAQEQSGNASTGGEGLCMYDPGAPGVGDGLYVVNVQRSTFRVRMHPLTDADADTLLQVQPAVRQFFLGSEGEGCVADDATGALYLSEEDVGIWKYDLTAAGTVPPRVRLASLDANLSADVEGLALVGGELIASAQNVVAPRDNWYSRYDAVTGQHLGRFRIVDGPTSDDCDQTDGIAAQGGYLGPAFPQGLFVCQDGYNDAPGTSGTQNFKLAPLHLVDGVL